MEYETNCTAARNNQILLLCHGYKWSFSVHGYVMSL